MKNTYRHAAAILIAAVSLVSCAAPEGAGPIKGVVIDEATGSPIAGAVVRVLREGTGGGLGGSQTICFALQTATTDAKGVYEVSGVRRNTTRTSTWTFVLSSPAMSCPNGFYRRIPYKAQQWRLYDLRDPERNGFRMSCLSEIRVAESQVVDGMRVMSCCGLTRSEKSW